MIAFAISVILGPVIIPILRIDIRIGKWARQSGEDGVKSHLKKAGTPTMGGVIILLSVVVTSLLYLRDYPKIIPILFVTLGFGLIGFLDDYLKVVMKRSDGLYPKQKMALQIVVTRHLRILSDPVYGCVPGDADPLYRGKYLDIGWLAVPCCSLL